MTYEYLLCSEGTCKAVELIYKGSAGSLESSAICFLAGVIFLIALMVGILAWSQKSREAKILLAKKLKLTPEESELLRYV